MGIARARKKNSLGKELVLNICLGSFGFLQTILVCIIKKCFYLCALVSVRV